MSSETSDQRPVRLSTMATRPSEPEHLPCPRCDSTNTKFCYYNNYNLSQPRHFCKSCRRYWTRGGTLRNVPVGGGSRKSSASSSHKRPRPITTASMSSSTITTATTTSAPTGSSSSENMAHHDPLHGNPMSPMMHQMGSGSVPMSVSLMGCEVNLNEAVPEASNFGSFLTTHVGAGLLPFGGGFGLGLGSGLHGLGFGLGPLDWPLEPMDHHGSTVNSSIGLGGGGAGVAGGVDGNDNGNSGSGSGSGGSSTGGGCNTWQMGGGVEGGLGDGDCFGWPELAISMPGKGLK